MLEERFAAVSYTHLDVYKRQPNMAPDTIVLTVYMGDSPKALDIPMNAIPSVEIVPHEVPIIIDVSEHIKKDIIKKNSASIALRPIQIKAGTVPLIIQLATSAPISRSMMMGTSMPLIAVVTLSLIHISSRKDTPMQRKRQHSQVFHTHMSRFRFQCGAFRKQQAYGKTSWHL